MSKELSSFEFSLSRCEEELSDFAALLREPQELSESRDILPFFRQRPHISALSGSNNGHLSRFDRLGYEFDLFGNFRCDLVVGDARRRSFTLIEFEDARPNSIFAPGPKYHDEWGRRFEHGFSQLVDWFWALDDQRASSDFRRRFGEGPVRFAGTLVLGRRDWLTPQQRERLEWRLQRVLINSHSISCLTFDDLYESLRDRVEFIRESASQRLQDEQQ